jgi:hypothetical protein
MLETLITSKTRIKLLIKFFLNPNCKSYLNELAAVFKDSSNAVRIELNRFENAGLLLSSMESNRKVYTANTTNRLYPEIHKLLCKHLGLDLIIEQIAQRPVQVEQIWLCGELAKGNQSDTIELLLVGPSTDQTHLEQLRVKVANLISSAVKLTLYTPETFSELKATIQITNLFLLWETITPLISV